MCGRWTFWLVLAVVPAKGKGLAVSEERQCQRETPPKHFSVGWEYEA